MVNANWSRCQNAASSMRDHHGPRFAGVVGHVVEEHQSTHPIGPHLDDVETRRHLLEPIAIPARIEPERMPDDEPDRGLVRTQHHALAWMRADDLLKRAERAFEHVFSRFAAGRRKVERIVPPGRVLVRILHLGVLVAKPLPSAMIDFAQAVENRHRQSVRASHDGGCVERPPQRACVCSRERFACQSRPQELNLQASLGAKRHIRRSRKAILGTQRRRAVSHEQDSSRHSCFHSRNPPRNAWPLLPLRTPGGSRLINFALPPPRTTSSASSAALRRAMTSMTYLRHFLLPNRLRPALPTYCS